MNETLKPEDYIEPACPLCIPENDSERPSNPIPVNRVIQKLDDYFSSNDMAGAERHLDYWYSEAETGNDLRGLLSLENERMGLFRKTDQRDKAIQSAEHALELVSAIGLQNTLTDATTCINAATVYRAFSLSEKALPYYEHAKQRYELLLPKNDERLAGLYNNMALTLTELSRFAEARKLFVKAIRILAANGSGRPEQAISWLNLATLAEKEKGLEEAETEIEGYLSSAEALLNSCADRRDGDYAYACEKCASVFSYYGRFAAAAELTERAKCIYERS